MSSSSSPASNQPFENMILETPRRFDDEVVPGQFDDPIETLLEHISQSNIQTEMGLNNEVPVEFIDNQNSTVHYLVRHAPQGSVVFVAPPLCYLPNRSDPSRFPAPSNQYDTVNAKSVFLLRDRSSKEKEILEPKNHSPSTSKASSHGKQVVTKPAFVDKSLAPRNVFGVVSPSALLEHIDRDHPHESILPSDRRSQTLQLPMFSFVAPDYRNHIAHDKLTEADILMGRGGATNTNAGNKWFRKLIERYRKSYCTAEKGRKSLLVRNLCNYIRLNGGRFLEQITSEQPDSIDLHPRKSNVCMKAMVWYECGDYRAHAKVGQTLREGTASAVRETLKRNLNENAIENDLPKKKQRKSVCFS